MDITMPQSSRWGTCIDKEMNLTTAGDFINRKGFYLLKIQTANFYNYCLFNYEAEVLTMRDPSLDKNMKKV